MLTAIGLLCFVFSAYGASVPSFITRCKLGDDACILSSAKSAAPIFTKGIPELGIKSVDPMFIPLIVSDDGGLKMVFHNSTLTGLTGCNIDAFKHDNMKKKQFLKITCDVSLSGQYEVKGQVLILPVEGNGKYNIDIRGITVKAHFNLAEVEKSGVSYWQIDNDWTQNYKYKVHNGAHFHLENLFKGNKILGDPVLELLNTNWKDIMDEIAPPIIKAIIGQEVEAVNTLYSFIPVDQFFIQ